MEWLVALQETGVGVFLRRSWWAYPLVNIVHVLGIASLFGSILVLDLKSLGLFRRVPRDALERPAVTVAAAGLAVALVSGFLLFTARASEYAAMTVFLAKVAFVVLGTVNAVAMRATGWDARVPALAAAVSLAAWTGAIVAGRLIGYGSS